MDREWTDTMGVVAIGAALLIATPSHVRAYANTPHMDTHDTRAHHTRGEERRNADEGGLTDALHRLPVLHVPHVELIRVRQVLNVLRYPDVS